MGARATVCRGEERTSCTGWHRRLNGLVAQGPQPQMAQGKGALGQRDPRAGPAGRAEWPESVDAGCRRAHPSVVVFLQLSSRATSTAAPAPAPSAPWLPTVPQHPLTRHRLPSAAPARHQDGLPLGEISPARAPVRPTPRDPPLLPRRSTTSGCPAAASARHVAGSDIPIHSLGTPAAVAVAARKGRGEPIIQLIDQVKVR